MHPPLILFCSLWHCHMALLVQGLVLGLALLFSTSGSRPGILMSGVSVMVASHLLFLLLHILPSCRSDRNCVDDGARTTFYILFIFYHRAVPSAVASMMVHVPPFTIC